MANQEPQRPDKRDIADYITSTFGYRLDQSLSSVRRTFLFEVSCEGTVPWALRAFLEADSFEEAVRNAISLGGDADTRIRGYADTRIRGYADTLWHASPGQSQASTTACRRK